MSMAADMFITNCPPSEFLASQGQRKVQIDPLETTIFVEYLIYMYSASCEHVRGSRVVKHLDMSAQFCSCMTKPVPYLSCLWMYDLLKIVAMLGPITKLTQMHHLEAGAACRPYCWAMNI